MVFALIVCDILTWLASVGKYGKYQPTATILTDASLHATLIQISSHANLFANYFYF